MDERQAPSNDFPVLVCEIIVPQGTTTASISGRVLKLPVDNPKKLIILGDSGCRLETGDPPQSCNEPRAWPFKQISETAASFNPDLVIHEGDYLYREDPCPEGDSGCQGSPSGDNFITWDADFSPRQTNSYAQLLGCIPVATTKSADVRGKSGLLF